MAKRELDIIVRLRDRASTGVKRVSTNVKGLGTASAKAASGMRSLHGQLVGLATVLAGGALFGKSVKDFATFDDNMRAAAAVTNATAAEMTAMTEVAQKMGRETRYTATQSAEALRFLGMAGFQASEAMEALPGVLNLAAAGALDLGTAADITTNILSGFGLEVENLAQVNDVLVQTFTNSNVNLTEIGEAFKIVGPIAKGVGADFEDLVGTIGALGTAGIKGTLAGTALKNSIDALLAPTAKEAALMDKLAKRAGQTSLQVKDASGNFVGFAKILEQLEAAGLRGDEALQAFGMRAGPGLAALMNMGSESLNELIEKLRDAEGVSKEVADKMEAGLGGEIRRTISVLESLRLKIGEAFGAEMIQVLEHFRGYIDKLIDKIQELYEDGTFEFWGEAVMAMMDAVIISVQKGVHAISALTSISIAAGAAIVGDFDLAKAAMEGWVDDMNKMFGTYIDPTKQAGVVTKKITQAMRDELKEASKPTGPIGTGAQKVGDAIIDAIAEFPNAETKLKAGLVKINAVLNQQAEEIKGQYAQGLIDIDEYYKQRASIITQRTNQELAILDAALRKEKDVNKRELLNAAIIAKRQELNTKLLALDNNRIKEEERLAKKAAREQAKLDTLKVKAEKAMQDQKARIREEGVTTLDTQFTKELSDLQSRQNKELDIIREYHASVLQALKDRKASEAEIEAAYEEEKRSIAEQQALQQAEQEQMLADQQLRLAEYKMENMKQMAKGVSDLFTQLYQLTGEQSKELFYAAKAAALAEATINIAQGVTKALAQGGIFGIATGALVAAAGAVQIGTILSQGLAEGGEVAGYSPHAKADNISINATAGEFMEPVSSVRHYGLDVMEGLRRKTIPKSIFAGYSSPGIIPKGGSHFAEGGMIGSGGGKPTAGGGTNEEGVNIVNVIDPALFEQYMGSSAGQKTIMNVIEGNGYRMKKIVNS